MLLPEANDCANAIVNVPLPQPRSHHDCGRAQSIMEVWMNAVASLIFISQMAEIRLAVGGTVWNSLYQGNPGAAQGQIFKRSWFNHYTARPERFTRIVQSWDTAFKSGSSNDYSVCTTWGECDSGYYLLHLWRGKPEFPELKRQFCSLAARWRPHSVTVEDKASGQSLIQELRVSTPFPVKPIKIDADKITRASSITGYFEAGKIFFPKVLRSPQNLRMNSLRFQTAHMMIKSILFLRLSTSSANPVAFLVSSSTSRVWRAVSSGSIRNQNFPRRSPSISTP